VLVADSTGDQVRVRASGWTADKAVALAERKGRPPARKRLRPNRLEGRVKNTTIHLPPGRPTAARAARRCLVSPGELARLSPRQLEQLRRALARALGQVELGSPASQLLGRLSRQTRSELRRRRPADQHGRPAA
jgi:hypothetical protein